MNIALIGANGRVGKELSFLLRHSGHNVRPIVRTKLATSFLEYHDFDCRVADISNPEGAREALQGTDLVIVAAFSRQYAQGFDPKETREANTNLVRMSVRYAPPNATIVYFSSIAIFSDEVGLDRWDWYAREKRNAEKTLITQCDRHDKDGYALRMGPVVGKWQARSQRFQDVVTNGEAHLLVDPAKESNILHTVTIHDAVLACGQENFERSIFTLVNCPRWTWREVFEYYAPDGSRLYFHDDQNGDNTAIERLLQSAKQFVETRERSLRSFSVYLPDRLNQFVFHKYVQSVVGGEVEALRSHGRTDFSEFEQDPAPGPILPELPETERSLQEFAPVLDRLDSVS